MVTKQAISWFITDQGRKFSFAVVTTAGISFSLARYVPNTFGLQKYVEFVRYYSKGHPVELSNELNERCKKCMDIIDLAPTYRKLVSPFSIHGYDLFHAGSFKFKYGSAIGIPVHFTYKSFDDVQKHDILVNQKKVDWSTEAGKKLAESLILPEKVQQFAIIREILMTMNLKVMFESSYPFLTIYLAYTLSNFINTTMNLYAAPRMLRCLLYTIVGSFASGLYFLFKDMTQVYYEAEVDKKLCELGPDYIESGIIFYDKLLQRNQALRELMGEEGKSKYTIMGNENYLMRQPHIALVHRKKFFEEKLKEVTDKKADDTVLE